MIVLELTLFYLVALLLLSYGGYGPTKLILRGRLRGFGLLLMPLVGYSFLTVFSSYASVFLNMTWSTWAFLVLATLLNGYAMARGDPFGGPSKDQLVVLGLSLLTYILGVLPLVHAGGTPFVGLQWDLEIYLPFVEYLKSYPIGSALVGPPENPLVGYLNSPAFRGGSGWGFSYLEAALGTLLGWESFQTFRPTLQFVLSLSVPSVYIFCRTVLGISGWGSVLAAGLWALNGHSLWVASMGLAGHAASFFALPMAIAATFWALEAPNLRLVLLAGLTLAGLLLSFYTGALPMYLLPVAALGAIKLVKGPGRRQVILAGLGIGGAVGVFALVGHLRFLEVVPAFRALGFSQGWRVSDFSPLSVPLGLLPYPLVAERVSPAIFLGPLGAKTVGILGEGLIWAGFLMVTWALFRPAQGEGGWNRRAFLAIAISYGAFLFYLRVVSPYPYGYFKALSLGAFFMVAALAQGAVALWASGLLKRAVPAKKGLVVGLGILFIPTLLFNTFLSARYFWDQDPQELPRQVWEMRDLRRILPKGGEVYVSKRSGYDPRLAGMVAYFLRDNPIVGSLKTAYGELNRFPLGQRYSYLLLSNGEDPRERGLTEEELLWSNDLVSLYRAPPEWLAVLELEDMGQAFSLPQNHLLMETSPESWVVGSDKETWEVELPQKVSQMQSELTLLLFSPETLAIELGDQRYNVSLPAGLVSYRTPPFSTPSALRIQRERAGPPLWVLGARVALPGKGEQVHAAQNLFALIPSLRFDGGEAQLALDYLTSEVRGGYLTLALELYAKERNPEAKPVRAWEMALMKGLTHGEAGIVVNLSLGECQEAPFGPAQFLLLGGPPPLEGEYEAQLAVYYVGEEMARWPWFAFAVGKNAIVREHRQIMNFPYFLTYLPIPREVSQVVRLIPPGEAVYLSPKADPDRSFIPLTAYLLAQRDGAWPTRQGGFSFEGPPPSYALLWQDEDPQVRGFWEYEQIWEGQEATLYRKKGEASTLLKKDRTALLPGEFYARTQGAIKGDTALVRIDYEGPRPVEAYLGIDVYRRGPCRPVHYGWWALPLASAGLGMEFSLDLIGQKGRMALPSGEEIPLGFETWPSEDGAYRAFLQLKYGESYLSFPAFEFTLEEGKVVAFDPYDVDQVASLTDLR